MIILIDDDDNDDDYDDIFMKRTLYVDTQMRLTLLSGDLTTPLMSQSGNSNPAIY